MEEIRRLPVEVGSFGSLSRYLQGYKHPRWCRISSINSSAIKSVERGLDTGYDWELKDSFLS